MPRTYSLSPAIQAKRNGEPDTERLRVLRALAEVDGNVSKALREKLPDYSTRTLKRWIKRWGLAPQIAAMRKQATARARRLRADLLASGSPLSPNGGLTRPASAE